jgi:outer membrane protein OmpA-like peptidoglycan-associated protein
MHTLNLGGAYRFSDSFQVGLSSFFSYEQAVGEFDTESKEKFVAGDTTIDFKYKFFEKNKLAIAFTPRLYLPTGNDKYYTSNDELGYYLGFALDKAFRFFQLAVNLGHKQNSGAVYKQVDHESQLHFSVGALIPLVGYFDLTAEFFRDTPYDSSNDQVPSEANLGLRYSTNSEEAFFAGIGSGSLKDSQSIDARLYAGYKFFGGKIKSEKIMKEEKEFGRFYKTFNIYFKTGSSIIKDEERPKLDKMAEDFKSDPYLSNIIVEGYSSKLGSETVNNKISSNRSKRVMEYLLSKGISTKKIKNVFYGNSKADKSIINKDEDRKVSFRLYKSK